MLLREGREREKEEEDEERKERRRGRKRGREGREEGRETDYRAQKVKIQFSCLKNLFILFYDMDIIKLLSR